MDSRSRKDHQRKKFQSNNIYNFIFKIKIFFLFLIHIFVVCTNNSTYKCRLSSLYIFSCVPDLNFFFFFKFIFVVVFTYFCLVSISNYKLNILTHLKLNSFKNKENYGSLMYGNSLT